jgi:hypothetical protein
MVGTGRQYAGSVSVGAGEGDLIAKPDDLALKDGHAGLDVIMGVRHGAILLRDPHGRSLTAISRA